MSARIAFAASNGGYSFTIALAVASDIGTVEHRRQVGLIVERHSVVAPIFSSNDSIFLVGVDTSSSIRGIRSDHWAREGERTLANEQIRFHFLSK